VTKGDAQAYTIGLSINEDLKLEKRKGEEGQRRSKFYAVLESYKLT
jgi:hypothetical protein